MLDELSYDRVDTLFKKNTAALRGAPKTHT